MTMRTAGMTLIVLMCLVPMAWGVALNEAIQMAQDDNNSVAENGMSILANDYWSDDLAKQTLEAVAEPQFLIRGVMTRENYAALYLDLLLAKRKVHEWFAQANTPGERLNTTRKLIAENPDWPTHRPADDNMPDGHRTAFRLMIEQVMTESDTDAIDLAMTYPQLISDDYVQMHQAALIEWIERLGRDEVLARPQLLQAMTSLRSDEYKRLVTEWLSDTTDPGQITALLTAAKPMLGRDELERFADDARPEVVLEATSILRSRYRDERTIATLDRVIARLSEAEDVDPAFVRILNGRKTRLLVALQLEGGREQLILKLMEATRYDIQFRETTLELVRNYPDARSLNALETIKVKIQQENPADERIAFIAEVIEERLKSQIND